MKAFNPTFTITDWSEIITSFTTLPLGEKNERERDTVLYTCNSKSFQKPKYINYLSRKKFISHHTNIL